MKASKKPDILSTLPPEYREQVDKYVKKRMKEVVMRERSELSTAERKKKMQSEFYKNIANACSIASELTGVSVNDVIGRTRKRTVADVRLLVYRWALDYTTMGTVEVGRWFNRDHSTVIIGARRAKDLLEVDKNFAHLYNQFINKLTGKQYEVSNISQRAADYTSGKVDVLVHRVAN
jgi:chromosomal replication initiation ATPase DnaA